VARANSAQGETAGLIGLMRGHPSAKVLVPFNCFTALQYYFPEAAIRSYSPDVTAERIVAAAADMTSPVCIKEEKWLRSQGMVNGTPPARLPMELACYLRP